MSIRTGPWLEIYADTTIPGTAAVAMTAFEARGNRVHLKIKTTTGGCSSLTITAEISHDGGTTYGAVIDRNSVWSIACTTPTAAGTYWLPLEGLQVCPGDTVRLSYQAGAAAGKLQVEALCWEQPGGSADVTTGDLYVSVDGVEALLATIDADTSKIPIGTLTKTAATGAVAIAASTGALAAAARIRAVTCHLSAAPTTSENFTVTLNATDGAAYDTVLLSIDPSATGMVDIVWMPSSGEPVYCVAGDSIDVAYANTDTVTYGVRVVMEN